MGIVLEREPDGRRGEPGFERHQHKLRSHGSQHLSGITERTDRRGASVCFARSKMPPVESAIAMSPMASMRSVSR